MNQTIRILGLLLFFSLAGCHPTKESDIRVEFSNNTETLFIIYTLADIGVMPRPGSLSYQAAEAFAPYKDHPAVVLVEHIVRQRGVGHPVHLIQHFSEVPDMQLEQQVNKPDAFFEGITHSEAYPQWLEDFRIAFTSFYHQADVAAFLKNHRTYYEQARKDLIRHLPSSQLTQAMESFYGQQPAGYVLNPSPVLFPTWGFGTRREAKEGLLVYNTFGPQRKVKRLWSDIHWDFDHQQEVHNLTVHEFGHSFVNPITQQPQNRELIERTAHLLEPIAHQMAQQGYRTWWTCLTEHLVRLGEIRIAEATGDRSRAEFLRSYHIQRKHFIYLPQLEKKILEYEANREQYPRLGDFFPELLEALQADAPIGEEQQGGSQD